MSRLEHSDPGTLIAVEATADCPFSIAQEYAERFLRAAEAGGPEAEFHVRCTSPPIDLHHRVGLTFGLHLDLEERGRRHDEIRICCSGGSPLLPTLRGTLRFRILRDRTMLLLLGCYHPPLGLAGQAFDIVAGERIARSTLADLIERIAADLTRQHAAWLNQFPQEWRRQRPTASPKTRAHRRIYGEDTARAPRLTPS